MSIEFPATWATARKRWESPDGRYFFDEQAADRAEQFFPDLLVHHIGEWAGQPFRLMPYQVALMTRPIFGWKRAEDGRRRVRKLFAFIPKGGGKSPWASGTGIYMARCDGESASEVYAIANDREQGRIVHNNAKVLIEKSPLLLDGCEILKDSIYWADTHSTFQVLSSDAATAHGKRPHCLIVDELHGFVSDRDRELFEALKKSMPKRRQPLLIMISHAGTNDEGLCHEEYEYAKAVISGSVQDDTHLPVVFEASPADDWTSEEVLRRVHPGYGVTMRADALRTELVEAIAEPRKQHDYKRYYLNLWVSGAEAWIPVEWWDACDRPLPPDEELRDHACAIGVDMAQKIDLGAGVVAFRLPLDEQEQPVTADVAVEGEAGVIEKRALSLDFKVAVLPAFWLPEETLVARVKHDAVPYDVWARTPAPGSDPTLMQLTPVEGAILGATPIVHHFAGRMLRRFPSLKKAQVAYDPAFATEVALALRDNHGFSVVEVQQNYRQLSEAAMAFEALVKARRIMHGGHRLLRWCVENTAIRKDDAGRIKPVKPKKATKRIDGVVALILAISRLILMPPMERKSRRPVKVWTPSGWQEVGAHA